MSRRKRKSKSTRAEKGAVIPRPDPRKRDGGAPLLQRLAYPAPIWCPISIVLLGLIAYFNSFDGVFVFDDLNHIIRNERIHEVWPPWRLLAARRPTLDFSLAINYAIGKTDPWGYHLVNIVIHLLSGLTLYGIVRRTVARWGEDRRHVRAAPLLALIVAAIWTVHPLQTQSVTYIVQRSESMMGMFFLLTLYCVIRGVDSRDAARWFAAAVAACALGVGSKAVALAAPVVILLYDGVFLAPSFAHAVRQRGRLYLGLFSAAGLVFILTGVAKGVLASSGRSTVGFGTSDVTSLGYALSQPGVIVHYLSLAFWPAGLLLDHKWPVAETAGQIVPQALIIGMLLLWTVIGLARRHWLGFVGAWFFVILAPTSSIVPIKDLAFEHRMYLPLAGVIAFVVIGMYAAYAHLRGIQRLPVQLSPAVPIALAMLATGSLSFATIHRNRAYHSEIAMWQDVVAKKPDNHRAFYNLGGAHEMARDMEAALLAYRESVRLEPEWSWSRSKLGVALSATGEKAKAIEQFREAIRLRPSYGIARFNLGSVLAETSDAQGAATEYRELMRIEPGNAGAAYNLGNVLNKLKRYDEAAEAFQTAGRLDPTDASAFYNLANTLRRLKRYEQAESAYRNAIEIKPKHANAHMQLGRLLEQRDRLEEAIEQYETVIELRPKHKKAGKALQQARKKRQGL